MKRPSIRHFTVAAVPTIARKALANSDTPSPLRWPAKRRTDATRLCLIFAALEWYFVNWVWALIPLGLVALAASQSAIRTMAASRLETRQSPGT